MIYEDLITKIRYRLADSQIIPYAYSNEMLIEFINDGIRDFAQTQCCQYTDVKESGSSIYKITPASDLTYAYVLKIYGIRYAGNKLDFAPPWEADGWKHDGPASGTPTGWTVWNKVIYLDASIATLSASNDLAIEYSYVPSDGGNSTITSTFPLADAYSEAIVSYATARALSADREGGLADREFQFYLAAKKTAGDMISEQVRGGYAV